MGNACKISRKITFKEAIVSVEDLHQQIIIPRPHLDENELNPMENLNIQNNKHRQSDVKTVSQKTDDTLPQKDIANQAEFEESAPKQFVEIQINHLKKHDSLKNEEAIGNDVFYKKIILCVIFT